MGCSPSCLFNTVYLLRCLRCRQVLCASPAAPFSRLLPYLALSSFFPASFRAAPFTVRLSFLLFCLFPPSAFPVPGVLLARSLRFFPFMAFPSDCVTSRFAFGLLGAVPPYLLSPLPFEFRLLLFEDLLLFRGFFSFYHVFFYCWLV